MPYGTEAGTQIVQISRKHKTRGHENYLSFLRVLCALCVENYATRRKRRLGRSLARSPSKSVSPVTAAMARP